MKSLMDKLWTVTAKSVFSLSGKRLQERKMSGSLYGSDKAGVSLTQLTITRTDHVHLPSRQTSMLQLQS